MKWITIILIVLIAALAGVISLFSEEYGAENAVSIITEMKGPAMEIRVKNRSFARCTVTIYFTKFENAESDTTLPVTSIVPAGSIIRALTVRQKDPRLRWDTFFMYNYRVGSISAAHDDNSIYRLPYRKGQSFIVIQGYDGASTHHGEYRYSIDWDMPQGTEVTAAREGTVVEVEDRYEGRGFTDYYRNRNNYVLIEHSDGTIGSYVHFMKGGVRTAPGRQVKAGDLIALSGDVGFSGSPHLHFNVYRVIDSKTTESIPVRFQTGPDKAEILSEGIEYRAF